MLAPLAVEVLVEAPGAELTPVDRGDDKAGVGLRPEVFDLRDHSPFCRPAIQRPIPEVFVASSRLPSDQCLAPALFHPRLDHLFQARVFGQSEDVVDPDRLAEGHDALSREGTISICDDLRFRPSLSNRLDQAAEAEGRPLRGVDVRAPQNGRQAEVSTKHVERKVAVAGVVVVKKDSLLLPVQRIVGRVEIENDLFGREAFLRALLHLVGREEGLDEEGLDLPEVCGDLLVAGRGRRDLFETI